MEVCSGVWRWCSGVWRCVVVCGGVWWCVEACGGGVVGCGGGVVLCHIPGSCFLKSLG